MLCAEISLSRMATKARPVGERSRLSASTMHQTSETEAKVVEAAAVAADGEAEQLDRA